jgi:hypothetical protein
MASLAATSLPLTIRHWAANLQPEPQKLLWRLQATSVGHIFHRKIKRTEGEIGFALPPAVWGCFARRMARRRFLREAGIL